MNASTLHLVLLVAALLPAAARPASAEVRAVAVAPGETLAVSVEGSGPAVVLVPGLLGSAFAYRDVVPRLTASGHRVVVVEPLGIGSSSRPRRGDYSLTAQADRIARVLEALEVEDATVVGHAAGASMAMRLACRHPGRVRAVVALEGGPAETVSTPGFRFAMRFAPLLKLFGRKGLVRGKVRDALVSRSGDPRFVNEAVVHGYTDGAARDLGATLDAFSAMSRAVEPEALAPRLHELRCPVLLVVGSFPHDGGPPPAEIALMRRELPQLAVVRLPGVGHFVFEEAPAAVAEAIAGATTETTTTVAGGAQ